jgi:NADH-quinone oxidoreductase subunit I
MFGQGLVKGLRITGKRMVGKGVCEMYPYRRKTLPAKSRIFLSMNALPDGTPACRACLTCQTTCPDHVIRIERDPEDRKKVTSFTVDSGRCTFCGMCEEGCTFGALVFTQDFERASFEKDSLTYALVKDGAATDACVIVEPAEEPEPAASEGGGDAG